MDAFKVPHNIPQDLLLIHDLIGVPTPPPPSALRPQKIVEDASDDCIDSSDSEIASEDEIEADLTAINDDEDELPKSAPESDSSSEDSDSDSDESDMNEKVSATLGLDDDEESGPAPASGAYFQTKNEVVEADIVVPDIAEVGPEEYLEKVGEIMTIMGNTVIIHGVASETAGRGSERVLDSDTLLVFQDRKVMGYIYETFGPTSQPMYQVKFNKDFPLDPEKVQTSREVFHVPARSNFVFWSHLKKFKGSDASNVHDEEPAENELEFSDDEAEAAYKSNLKRKRGETRAQSMAASSRQSTPTPSQMHDQDMAENLSRNHYDEHGPYDVGFSAGPSRPPPIPYDDPYSDAYTSAPSTSQQTQEHRATREDLGHTPQNSGFSSRGRGRGQGRDRGDSRGRGRGRGRGGDHGGPSRGYPRSDTQRTRRESNAGDNSWTGRPIPRQEPGPSSYGQQIPRPLSPTSLAIARATGQLPNGSNYVTQHGSGFSQQPPVSPGAWGYSDPFQQAQQMFQFGAGYPQPFVQPHINPRFANAFGMNIDMGQHLSESPQYTPQITAGLPGPTSPSTLASTWTNVPSGQDAVPNHTGDQSES
ncbi:hypothetical protein DXG03_008461 [Asterophora parasitica]|uniref:H/ACA ribonucleoprotein complex non-core subunit NAF1 n=1 Tax=Asterophora parasitica TaxID=117018 RepID=A0A9P7GCX1_9AGAR|nr:hypothetical protein DXG03_008461 [Asterophora parasitica]